MSAVNRTGEVHVAWEGRRVEDHIRADRHGWDDIHVIRSDVGIEGHAACARDAEVVEGVDAADDASEGDRARSCSQTQVFGDRGRAVDRAREGDVGACARAEDCRADDRDRARKAHRRVIRRHVGVDRDARRCRGESADWRCRTDRAGEEDAAGVAVDREWEGTIDRVEADRASAAARDRRRACEERHRALEGDVAAAGRDRAIAEADRRRRRRSKAQIPRAGRDDLRAAIDADAEGAAAAAEGAGQRDVAIRGLDLRRVVRRDVDAVAVCSARSADPGEVQRAGTGR